MYVCKLACFEDRGPDTEYSLQNKLHAIQLVMHRVAYRTSAIREYVSRPCDLRIASQSEQIFISFFLFGDFFVLPICFQSETVPENHSLQLTNCCQPNGEPAR